MNQKSKMKVLGFLPSSIKEIMSNQFLISIESKVIKVHLQFKSTLMLQTKETWRVFKAFKRKFLNSFEVRNSVEHVMILSPNQWNSKHKKTVTKAPQAENKMLNNFLLKLKIWICLKKRATVTAGFFKLKQTDFICFV